MKSGRSRINFVDIDGLKIEVLTLSEATKYPGRKISFENNHDVELQNRKRAAWAKFSTNKQELTNRHYSLNDRLRLFEAVVTPTFLYGSGAWTLTQQMESKIRCVQRRMLRMIAGSSRRRLTTWTEADATHMFPTAYSPNDTNDATTELANIDSNDPQSGSDVSSNPRIEDFNEVFDDLEDGEDEMEPWVDFIRRVTHDIELKMKTLAPTIG